MRVQAEFFSSGGPPTVLPPGHGGEGWLRPWRLLHLLKQDVEQTVYVEARIRARVRLRVQVRARVRGGALELELEFVPAKRQRSYRDMRKNTR